MGLDPGRVAAGIAGATMGVTRYPYINAEVGEYLLRIVRTMYQDFTNSFVLEADILESSRPDVRPPGMRASYVQSVSSNDPRATAARQGALLACIIRSMGFATKEDALAHGFSEPALVQYINDCFREPGPLATRHVRAIVQASGRTTRNGETINNIGWIAVA